MPDYRRFRVPGGTYFFTVNLLERRRDTLVRHVDALREAVRATRRERPFHIDAWVVLPDHMHCVWTLPEARVGWGEARTPTFFGGGDCVGVPSSPQPTIGWWHECDIAGRM